MYMAKKPIETKHLVLSVANHIFRSPISSRKVLRAEKGLLPPNISLQLTFDSPLGLATPSPHVDSNAAELRRYALFRKKLRNF